MLLTRLLQLSLPQNGDLHVGGEKLLQSLLDVGDIAGDNDVLLKVGRGIEDQTVGGQLHRLGLVKPGIQGGGGQVLLHESEDCFPDLGGRVGTHGLLPRFSFFGVIFPCG